MSKKIIDKEQLCSLLSTYAKVNPEVAKAFIDSMSMVIKQALQDNDEVRISGLGLFKTIITQQGGRRVAFTPDEKLRTHINAPFSCFEPIVIGMMDKQENQNFVPIDENFSVKDTSENVSSSEEETCNEKENIERVLSGDIEPDNKTTDPFGIISENIVLTELADKEVSDLTQEKYPDSLLPTEENKATDISPKTKRSKYIWMWMAFIFIFIVGFYWFMNNTYEIKTDILTDEQSYSLSKEIPDSTLSSHSPIVYDTINSLAVVKEDVVFEESASETIYTSSTESSFPKLDKNKDNEGRVENLDVKSTPSSTKKKVNEDILDKMIKRREDGERVFVQLGEGERLTLIALREYGDKAFWGYIFEVNRDHLKSPGHVTVGVKLYLPDEQYWQIDSTDENSLRKARQHCANILKEFE